MTLRDRPPAFFARTSLEDAHELFARLGPALDACPTARPDDPGSFAAARAIAGDGEPARRRRDHTVHRASNDRAARVEGILQRRAHAHVGASRRLGRATGAFGVEHELDPGEDFDILLDALRRYDVLARADARRRRRTLPDLVVIVTGKGPQRDAYEARMASLALRHVAVRTAWLSFEDYPTLLGAADLGVCLHTSSSGLDLPMKVVDMQGAGLPVAAVRYDVVRELVREEDEDEDEDGEAGTSRANGVLFDDGEELSRHLARLLQGWWTEGGDKTELERLREGAAEAATERWAENWERNALPLFREARGGGAGSAVLARRVARRGSTDESARIHRMDTQSYKDANSFYMNERLRRAGWMQTTRKLFENAATVWPAGGCGVSRVKARRAASGRASTQTPRPLRPRANLKVTS